MIHQNTSSFGSRYFILKRVKLLSSQVNEREIDVITRELRAVLAAEVAGDVVEFGCFIGTTSVFLADILSNSERTLWLYDSFAGLPEKTDADYSPAGEQFQPGKLFVTRKQLEHNLRRYRATKIHIKKGWFSELSERDVPDRIAFAFLDGDYYASILDPLRLIWSRLEPGACVVVDDYVNEALPGAARAVDEWARMHGVTVKSEQSLAIFHKNA